MLIKNIHVKNFRNLASLNLDLGPGITLIKANNEGGKSSLRKALGYAFYVDPKSSSSAIKSEARWGQENMYEIAAEFTAGDQEYRLVKDFETKTSVLENLSAGKKLTGKKAVTEAITGILGLPTPNLLKSTVYFSAEELGNVKNTADLRRRLEEKLTGVEGVSVTDLVNKIDKSISDLQKGLFRPAKDPGPVKIYQDKLLELKSKLQAIKGEVENTAQSQARLTDLNIEIESIKKLLELKLRENEKYAGYKKLKEQLDGARKELENFTRRLELHEELTVKKEELLQEAHSLQRQIADYEQALAAVNELMSAFTENHRADRLARELKAKKTKIDEATKTLDDAVKEREQCVNVDPADLQQSEKLATQIQALSLAGREQGFKIEFKPLSDIEPEILVDGQTLRWQPGEPIEARAGAVITIPGVAQFTVSNKNDRAAGNLARERELSRQLAALHAKYNVAGHGELKALRDKWLAADLKVRNGEKILSALLEGKTIQHYNSELDRAEKQAAEARGKIDAAAPRARQWILKLEPELSLPADLQPMLPGKQAEYGHKLGELKNKHLSINNQYQQAIGKLETLPSRNELEKGKKDAALKLYVAETAFEKLNLPEISAEQMVRLENEIENLKKQLEIKINEKARLEASISVARYGIEDILELEESIRHYEDLHKEAIERVEVLKKVRDFFEEARKNTLARVAGSIGKQAAEYFNELTGGRYPNMDISPDGLEITVYSREKGERLDIDSEMSTGTRDQLYFSVRLAMIPAVAAGRKPPIIMDDPLVYFDPERRERAFNILKKLAREHQVIIFSCHNYYDTLADRCLALP